MPGAVTSGVAPRTGRAAGSAVAAIGLLVVLAGCSPGWQPVNTTPTPSFDERTTVRVHTDTGNVTLHAVRIANDTLSGIPWTEHTSCESCRVRFALGGISRLETGNPGAPAWWILGPFVGFILLGLALRNAFPST